MNVIMLRLVFSQKGGASKEASPGTELGAVVFVFVIILVFVFLFVLVFAQLGF